MFKVKDGLRVGATNVIDSSGNLVTGGVLTTKLTAASPDATNAYFNIGSSNVTPSSLSKGDLWINGGNLFFRDNNATTRTLVTTAAATFTGSITASNLSGTNTGDQTISITGDVTASGSTGVLAATVSKINGVALSGLATGILKNTTATGVPSIAVAADFPTLNQNTTGSAATLATGRTIGMTGDVTWTSTAFDGSANVTGTSAIGANKVTRGMLAATAAAAILGATAAGNVADLTGTQATALLDTATSSLKGLMSSSDFSKLGGVVTQYIGRSVITTAGGVFDLCTIGFSLTGARPIIEIVYQATFNGTSQVKYYLFEPAAPTYTWARLVPTYSSGAASTGDDADIDIQAQAFNQVQLRNRRAAGTNSATGYYSIRVYGDSTNTITVTSNQSTGQATPADYTPHTGANQLWGTLTVSGALTASNFASGASVTGTNTGDQTITLTGDVTGTGTGSFATTIGANKVGLSQMAQVATGTVFYRKTAATGNPEVQTLATLKTDLGLTGTNSGDQTISITGDVTASGSTGALTATVTKINGVALSGLATGILKNTTTTGVPSIAVAADFPILNQSTTGSAATLTTARTIAMTGDVTWTSPAFDGSGNVTAASAIGANKVTRGMLAATAGAAILGATAAGNVADLTGTQATSLLNAFTGDSGFGGVKGLVPAPASGDATKFLKGDGTWTAISTGTTTNALTLSNSGSGAASGSTFNGSSAITISYNSIGAQPLSTQLTNLASAAWSAGTQVITLTAANTVTLKTVGQATGNILDKAAGDALYQPVGSYAPASGSANYQAADATLTGVAGLSWVAGTQVPVMTAVDTFSLKTVGSATGNILDKASGDALYAPISGSANYQAASTLLTAYAGQNWAAGVQVPTLTASNTIALKTVGAATGNLLDKASGDSLYLGLGGGTLTGKLTTVASATGGAGLTLPHGAAPTAPTNGDVWTTTSGLFARVNGATQGPFSTTTGTVTSVTLTQPAAGITLTNSGVSQTTGVTSTVALANDLAAVEGLSTTGIVRRTATDTWSAGTLVALSELATQPTGTFVANNSGSTGSPTAVTATNATAMLDLVVAGGAKGLMSGSDKTKLDAITGTNTGDQTITLTGDVTGTGTGSFATAIGANKVTRSMLAATAGPVLLGATAAGNVADLTGTQATTLLDLFSPSLQGLAPASGGGTTNFLRADGVWANPATGPGGNPTMTTTEVNVGTTASRSGSFNITTTGLTPGAAIYMQQAPGPYTNKGTQYDEAEMDSVAVVAYATSSTNINVMWHSATQIRGNFKFQWFQSA